MSPLPNDPNGIPWELYGYTSYEAFIEAKAGSWDGPDVSGCDGCDDPDCGFVACRESKAGANPPLAHAWRIDCGCEHCNRVLDWPQEKPPPFAADDEDDPARRGDAA